MHQAIRAMHRSCEFLTPFLILTHRIDADTACGIGNREDLRAYHLSNTPVSEHAREKAAQNDTDYE